MHKALTGEDKQNPDVKRSMLGDVEIQARISPVSETTIFRLMTRFTQTCYPQPSVHPRYVLVLNSDGFPPLDTIINDAEVMLPEVWVIDADWDPPVEGDGFKDADGYEGRLKVRFGYNFYMHFYPLTKENGFDMKKLWMEQTDHEKPYPFPGHDITYGNVREKVPWTGSETPAGASMAQFLELVEKDEDVAPAVLAEKEDGGGGRENGQTEEEDEEKSDADETEEIPNDVWGQFIHAVANDEGTPIGGRATAGRGRCGGRSGQAVYCIVG